LRSLTDSPCLGKLRTIEHERVVAWTMVSLNARPSHATPGLTPQPLQLSLQRLQLGTRHALTVEEFQREYGIVRSASEPRSVP
jgi:hypothetical protein